MAQQRDPDKIRRHLAVMGLSETAGMKELRDAYHRKASILHPDKRPDDAVAAEAFKKVNIAYEQLKRHFRSNPPATEQDGRKAPKNPAEEKGIARPADPAPAQPKPSAISVDELVFRLKHSQNKYVRIHAIKALEEVGGRESAWEILPALDDLEEEVAICAAGALGRMKARVASLPLISLHRKSSPAARAKIEEALALTGSPMAARYLSGLSARRQSAARGDSDLLKVKLEYHTDHARA